jgi:hypothetical protein
MDLRSTRLAGAAWRRLRSVEVIPRRSRVRKLVTWVFSVPLLAGILTVGAGALAGQSAGAASPLFTAVLHPWNGADIHGTQALDAVAWAGFRDNVTSVDFVLTGGSYKKSVIGTARPSIFGWVFIWNTADIANGTCELRSMATDATGDSAYSPKVTISVANPLEVVPLISQFPTVTVGYSSDSGPYEPYCTGNADVADFAQVLDGTAPYQTSFSTSPPILFSSRYLPTVFAFKLPGDLSFEPEPDVGSVYVGGTPENEAIENSTFTVTVTDATGASASLSFPWTILNPDGDTCAEYR